MPELSAKFDTLKQKFLRLESEVRQRDCEHPFVVEVTTFGDSEPKGLCAYCSLKQELSEFNQPGD